MAFDNFFKELMREVFKEFEIQSEVAVGNLPLKIDLVIRCEDPLKTKQLPIMTKRLKEINLCEFKSSHDRPKKSDLVKLIGYLGLYCNQQDIDIGEIPQECSLWYVSSQRPLFLDLMITNEIIQPESDEGLYTLKIAFPCPLYIIVINELEICEENLPLLLQASGPVLSASVNLILEKNLIHQPFYEKYLTLNYFIYYKDLEIMAELDNILPSDVKENIRLAVQHLGIKRVIDSVGLKAVIEEMGLKAVIEEMGLKAVIEEMGLKAVIKEMGLKEILKSIDSEILESVDNLDQIEDILIQLKKEKKLTKSKLRSSNKK